MPLEIEIKKSFKLFTNINYKVSEESKKWGKSGIVNVFSTHTSSFVRR